jgi:hypothetical protein
LTMHIGDKRKNSKATFSKGCIYQKLSVLPHREI